MKSYKGLCDIVIDVQQKSTLAAGSKMAWRVWFQAAGESWEAVGHDSELPNARLTDFSLLSAWDRCL